MSDSIPKSNPKSKRTIICVSIIGAVLALALILGLAIGIPIHKKNQEDKNFIRAKDILERNILIDGHNDLAYMVRENFRNKLQAFNLKDMKKYNLVKTENVTHTDLIRLQEGKLGGQFWAVYADCETTGKDATRVHLEQIDVMKRIIKKYSDVFEFVTTADGMEQAFRNKKLGSMLGMESAHAIDSSMGLLRIFHTLGVRYMTLTHNCDVPWATNNLVDNKPNPASFGGLNEFGKLVIQEMNRLGMIVDISHVSTKTMEDVLEVSKAPVMFSHSSVYQLCNHTRNVKDHVLKKLKENNGVIMINFYNEFLTCSEDATVDDIVEHIQYVKKLIGVDYIGIGADYDGVLITPDEAEDVSKFPNVFAQLLAEGWIEEELTKLAGGNILRVIRANEKYSIEMREIKQLPCDVEIDPAYLKRSEFAPEFEKCRTDL